MGDIVGKHCFQILVRRLPCPAFDRLAGQASPETGTMGTALQTDASNLKVADLNIDCL